MRVHMCVRVCVYILAQTVYNGNVSRIRIKLLIGFLNDITTASKSWKNCWLRSCQDSKKSTRKSTSKCGEVLLKVHYLILR